MPPDEPGAPSPGPRDTGSTATFPTEVEPADAPDGPTEPSSPSTADPQEPASRKVAPRRRFLDDPDPDAAKPSKAPKRQKVRARKVRRIVRHVEPWSVLKVSVLFFLSIFLIICVASAVLWNTARSAGAIDDVESFITSLGFGNCEGDGATTDTTTPTTISGADPQLGGSTTTVPVVEATEDELSTIPDEDGKCAEGQRLVGGFKFEDERIFQSFALGGIVLVLSGAAFSVVLALLFNLISDLTGGVRVTVLEEDPVPGRRPADARPAPRTKA
jgi:Transmembrane domain of unknown function (DUF3566)